MGQESDPFGWLHFFSECSGNVIPVFERTMYFFSFTRGLLTIALRERLIIGKDLENNLRRTSRK